MAPPSSNCSRSRVPYWLHYDFQTKSLKGVTDYMLYKRLFSVIRSHCTFRQGRLLIDGQGRAYQPHGSCVRRPDGAMCRTSSWPTVDCPHTRVTSFRCYPDCVSVTVLGFGTALLPQEPCARWLLSSQPPSSPKQPFIFLNEFPGLDVWCEQNIH